MLLVKKSDGGLRMCVDYRALNKQTVRDRFPLPHIEDLLNRLAGARTFSKIDLKQGFWQLRVAPEDEHKTAFVTHGLAVTSSVYYPWVSQTRRQHFKD